MVKGAMGLQDWWNKWTSGGAAGADEGPIDPAEAAERVGSSAVSTGLTIHEYRHALAGPESPRLVRTFVTEGLLPLGSQEVRATVPRSWDASSVESVVNVLARQERFVTEGRAAVLGGFTGLRVKGATGGDLLGITYARGTPVAGIDGAEAALVAVRLHEEELELVQKGLATRVLGALATRARFFPYPPWWEVRTEPAFGRRDQEHSLLERIRPWLTVGDAHLTRFDTTTLQLSLPPDAVWTFQSLWEQHPDTGALVLLTQLAPDADGQMVWVPGATEPQATAAGPIAPRRMGHAFAVLTRAETTSEKLLEDGLGLLLADADFDRVRDALIAGQDLALPVGDGVTLQLEFRPVDPSLS